MRVSSDYHFQGYPSLLAFAGLPILLLLHSTILVAAALFVLKFLPETKNCSLTEIHEHFSSTKTDFDRTSGNGLPIKWPTHEAVRVGSGSVSMEVVDHDKRPEGGKGREDKKVRVTGSGNTREGVRKRSTMIAAPSFQSKQKDDVGTCVTQNKG